MFEEKFQHRILMSKNQVTISQIGKKKTCHSRYTESEYVEVKEEKKKKLFRNHEWKIRKLFSSVSPAEIKNLEISTIVIEDKKQGIRTWSM